MVVSFLVFTLAVAVVEVGMRYGVMLYRFHQDAPDEVERAADQLVADVRSIMMNRGGPVASRTVYPILERNFQRAGLEIAVTPSPVTVTSIERVFDFTPRGVPAEWPSGTYKEASVQLRADEFCMQCHVDASVGDVLGTVTVRNYLTTRLGELWSEVRLTGAISIIKIIIHTVILFFLLRALLEPLLTLRSAVSRLAKGEAGASVRAEVRSTDEFGDLAHDLNVFLDRVDHILADLGDAIGRMVSVGDRVRDVTSEGRRHLEDLEGRARALDDADLVHRVHELRHTLATVAQLDEQLTEVATAGRKLLQRLEGSAPGEGEPPASDSTD